jgi:hypothetical protein
MRARVLPALRRPLVTVLLAGLAVAAGPLSARGPAAAEPQTTGPRWTKALVVVIPGEHVYHVAECPRLKGVKAPTVMSATQAQERKLTAHDCRAAIAGAQRSAKREQLVWVDLKTKRYHLTGCSLVGLPRAQMRLDQAMAAYKPCNACKPPKPE